MTVKVAVIDTNEAILDALKMVLEESGWSALIFTTGCAFLDSFDPGTPPDCVVLDPHLPNVEGTRVVSSLRRQKLDIPFIVLTASIDCPSVKKVEEAGARATLTKPVSAQEFVNCLSETIGYSTSDFIQSPPAGIH